MESYITVERNATAEFTEKRSRFIANVFPVQKESDALEIIAKLKKEYWDAKHNVYAYIIKEGNICRYTDDGEPSGTAGVPVLDVIKKQGIVDCLIVVTRYFGGVLLGTGGLVRAYSTATIKGLHEAHVITMTPCSLCEIECDYGDYDTLIRRLNESGGDIKDSEFTEKVIVKFAMEESMVGDFTLKLTESFSGRLKVNVTGTVFANIEKTEYF